ncbi:GNAT family N-acetyltransferase [Streptomyces sp. NPDC057757]|uniref:GNAT family N-acetyltransferase n=1 Tax=Streptomyces sp. NPDC057757 TaxID=3346241 RepID=UPI0036A5A024
MPPTPDTPVLAAGRLWQTRVATPQDGSLVQELHDRCSQRSLYQRYLSPLRRLPASMLNRLLEPSSSHTLLAQSDSGSPVAMGMLARGPEDQGGREVHLAVLVEDAWQRQGLGTALTERLLRLAEQADVSRVHADVLADNSAMLRILYRAGGVVRERECGVASLTVATARSDAAANFVHAGKA